MKTLMALLLASVAALAEVSPPQAGVPDTNQPTSVNPVAAPAPAAELTPGGNNEPLSYGLEDVVKMVQSGAGTDVVLSYVENSPVAYAPTATDVIRLHELGVPPQVTVAILKHGGTLRAQQQANQAKLQSAPPTSAPPANYSSAYNNPAGAAPETDAVNYSTYVYSGYPVYNYAYPSWWYASYPGFWFGYLWPYNNCGYYYSHGSWCYAPHYNHYAYGYGSHGYYAGYNNYPHGSWGYTARSIGATPRANYSTMPVNGGGRGYSGAPMAVGRGAPSGGMSRSVPSRSR